MDRWHGGRAWTALLVVVMVAVATAFVAGAQAAGCDDWTAGTTGTWTTSGDWSSGTPSGSGVDACLPASSTPYTVTLTSSQTIGTITIGAGATLVLQANSTNNSAVLTVNGSSDNAGEIDLTDTDATNAGNGSTVDMASGTLTNDGTIVSQKGAHGLGTREVEGDLTNASDGTITVDQNLQIDPDNNTDTFSTAGALTVNTGAGLYFNPGGNGGHTLDITGGTITNNGVLKEDWNVPPNNSPEGNGTLSISGGTMTGNPIVANDVGLSFASGGDETVQLTGTCTLTNLANGIPAGYTVVLDSLNTLGQGTALTVAGSFDNGGTIDLTDQSSSASSPSTAELDITSGTLTNDGTIDSQAGSGFGVRDIEGNLTNASDGTIDVHHNLEVDANNSPTFSTAGTIDVAAGAGLYDPGGSGKTIDVTGGTITNDGTFEVDFQENGSATSGAVLNMSGGTLAGSTPIVADSVSADMAGSATGTVELVGYQGALTGDVPSGLTVLLAGGYPNAGGALYEAAASWTNDGTIELTDPNMTESQVTEALLATTSGTLTNDGTIISDPGPGAIGQRILAGNVVNDGTIDVNYSLIPFSPDDIANPNPEGQLTNEGTVTIASGQSLSVDGTYVQTAGTTDLGGSGAAITGALDVNFSGVDLQGGTLSGTGTIGGTYSQEAGGTLAASIAQGGASELTVAGDATLGGTLAAGTLNNFKPTVGQHFQVLTAESISGQFEGAHGLSSGPFTIGYGATNVTLTAVPPTATVTLVPGSLSFGSTANTIAAGATVKQTFKLTSTGSVSTTLGTLAIAGPQASAFSLTADGCSGRTLEPTAGCTVSVAFAPGTAGDYSADVSIPDNAQSNPQQVALTGVAGPAGPRVTLSSSSLAFGEVGVRVASTPQAVTVTNTGSRALGVSSAAITGADGSDFALDADSCSRQSIPAGQSCKVGVTLTARAAGARSARLALADDAPDTPQSVELSGTALTTGTLTGRVLNGGIAGTPPPLAGATVEVCPAGGGVASCQSTTTSALGTYAVAGLAPGERRMEVLPPAHYLSSGSAEVDIVAGTNTEDFTLEPPRQIPAGLTVDGQMSGSGIPVSWWTAPDSVQVPLGVDADGTPGIEGVSVTEFWASPEGSAGAQPISFGRLEVFYRYDASGTPRFLSLDSSAPAPIGRTGTPTLSSIGRWSTTLTTSPAVGDPVRGLTVEGVFTPPTSATGTVGTVASGSIAPSAAPLHGLLAITVTHYSLFSGKPVATALDRSAATLRSVRRPRALRPADALGSLLQYLPKDDPCVPGPTYQDQGIFNLPDGDTWNAQTATLKRADGTVVQFTELPDYGEITLTGPRIASSGDSTYTEDIWNSIAGYHTSADPIINPDGNSDAGLFVAPDGTYVEDTTPEADAGRYKFFSDGSLSDSWTGTIYGPDGSIRVPGHRSGVGNPCPPDPPTKEPPPPDPPAKPKGGNPFWWFFSLFKDPSGSVTTTHHVPVAGAKVLLVRSQRRGGRFAPVPNGSGVMSPGNRRNPDRTTALGLFGWDVLPGFYEVQARRPGCTAGRGGGVAHTGVLTVPPPAFNLKIVLRCPRLRRRSTATKLVARKVPVGEVMVTATVRGHDPQGVVMFTEGRRTLGVVPLNGRVVRATLTIVGKRTAGIRAAYSGDGYNAPSSGVG